MTLKMIIAEVKILGTRPKAVYASGIATHEKIANSGLVTKKMADDFRAAMPHAPVFHPTAAGLDKRLAALRPAGTRWTLENKVEAMKCFMCRPDVLILQPGQDCYADLTAEPTWQTQVALAVGGAVILLIPPAPLPLPLISAHTERAYTHTNAHTHTHLPCPTQCRPLLVHYGPRSRFNRGAGGASVK